MIPWVMARDTVSYMTFRLELPYRITVEGFTSIMSASSSFASSIPVSTP